MRLYEKIDVVSANAVSGHSLLRRSAETAALNAKFKPTLLSGQAVEVTVFGFFRLARSRFRPMSSQALGDLGIASDFGAM